MKMTGFYDVSLTTPQRPHSRHPRGQLTQKAGLGSNHFARLNYLCISSDSHAHTYT